MLLLLMLLVLPLMLLPMMLLMQLLMMVLHRLQARLIARDVERESIHTCLERA